MMRALPLLFLTLTCAWSQTDIDNFSTETNDRFANDPSFVAAGFDFSGIGRTTQNDGRFATLISDNVFLTANHFRAAGEVTFFAGNDPTSTPIVRTITGGQQIGTSDFFIGVLDSAVPTTITRYNFFTGGLDLVTNELGQASVTSLAPGADINDTPTTASIARINGPTVFLGGISPTPGFSDVTNLTIGTNQVEFVQENSVIGMGSGAIENSIALITIRNQVGDVGFNTTLFEADLNGGDSGSPLFSVDDNGLTLLGLGSGSGEINLGTDTDPIDRDASIFSFTGNYSDEIQSFINANAISSIPEPKTSLLLLLSIGFLRFRNRRT